MYILRGETTRVYGANRSSSNLDAKRIVHKTALDAKFIVTVRPTFISKVNRVAYSDVPIMAQ